MTRTARIFTEEEIQGLIDHMQSSYILPEKADTDGANLLSLAIQSLVMSIADAYNSGNNPYKKIESVKKHFAEGLCEDQIMGKRQASNLAQEIADDIQSRARGRG